MVLNFYTWFQLRLSRTESAMGLETAIRNIVLKDAVPEAFEELSDEKEMKNGVVLWDILTFLHAAFNVKNLDASSVFTGDQLGWWLQHTLSKQMSLEGCAAGVVCMDNGLLTPKEKQTEQRRRSRARDSDPYPKNARFADGGIYFGNAAASTAIPFNMRRVMSTRGAVRTNLWNYLCDYLTRHWRQGSELLILDRAGDNPYVYLDGKWGRETGTAHAYGEADLATTYWIERLWDKGYSSFYVLSTDSDMICTTLAFMYHKAITPSSPRIHLRYWRKKGRYLWMSMYHVWQYLEQSRHWTIPSFLMFCCMCGTDFTDPKQARRPNTTEERALYHGLPPQHAWDAWVEFELPRYCHHAMSKLSVFRRMVRAVYSYVLTRCDVARGKWFVGSTQRQRFLETLESMQTRNHVTRRPFTWVFLRRICPRILNKVKLPTDSELKQIQGELQFNINYWSPAPAAPVEPVTIDPKTIIADPSVMAVV